MLLLTGAILALTLLTLLASTMTYTSQLADVAESVDTGVTQRYVSARTGVQLFLGSYDSSELPIILGEDLDRQVQAQLNLSLLRAETLTVRLSLVTDTVNETDLAPSNVYDVWTWDGTTHVQGAFDGTDDGILHVNDVIQAVLIFIELRGGDFRVQESLLYDV